MSRALRPNDQTPMPELLGGSQSFNEHYDQQTGSGDGDIPGGLLLPPLITHTAATPQGSPPSSAMDTTHPHFYVDDFQHPTRSESQSGESCPQTMV